MWQQSLSLFLSSKIYWFRLNFLNSFVIYFNSLSKKNVLEIQHDETKTMINKISYTKSRLDKCTSLGTEAVAVTDGLLKKGLVCAS